jgi:hypothetical protein
MHGGCDLSGDRGGAVSLNGASANPLADTAKSPIHGSNT